MRSGPGCPLAVKINTHGACLPRVVGLGDLGDAQLVLWAATAQVMGHFMQHCPGLR